MRKGADAPHALMRARPVQLMSWVISDFGGKVRSPAFFIGAIKKYEYKQ